MAKFVVFGANGVLGKTLVADLKASNQEVMSVVRNDIDIFNAGKLRDFLSTCGEAIFVNCVAFMPADKCELDPSLSQKVNVDFVESLAAGIVMNRKQRLIHFSSDFVFDGTSSTPYTEESKTNPLNIYGEHKVEAEKIVTESLGERGNIIRFASLVTHSQERKTFLEKVIDRSKLVSEIPLVSDLEISIATSSLISLVVLNIRNIDKGIIHAVHEGKTTWFSLASAVLEELEITIDRISVDSSEFSSVARRPVYSVLQPTDEVQSLDPRNWEVAVREYASKNLK